jgi:hypothetical protein
MENEMILTLNDETPQTEFVDYLSKLGCTVNRLDERRLEVSVEYPDTVEDEQVSLVEWCGSWAAARTGGVHLATAAA